MLIIDQIMKTTNLGKSVHEIVGVADLWKYQTSGDF